jgi:hypothetical protein
VTYCEGMVFQSLFAATAHLLQLGLLGTWPRPLCAAASVAAAPVRSPVDPGYLDTAGLALALEGGR